MSHLYGALLALAFAAWMCEMPAQGLAKLDKRVYHSPTLPLGASHGRPGNVR